MKRIIPIVTVVISVLTVGCGLNQTAHSAAKKPAAPPCRSQSVTYVLPFGSGAAINGTSAWRNLTMAAQEHGTTASIEAVIPSSPLWRVVRLTVPSSNAYAAAALVNDNQIVSSRGYISALACFTGWNKARLSHLASVTNPSVQLAADRIANGMDFFGPSVVQPGQKLYVIVEKGSVDGETYQQGTTGHVSWNAVNTKTHKIQFPVRLVSTAIVGTQMLAEFVIPTDAPSGSYVLAAMDGLYPQTYTGDFVFEVQINGDLIR